MILLTSTSDKVQVVTDAATPVEVHASWLDFSGSLATPDRKNTAIASVATTDVVPAPGAGVKRSMKALHARNVHATDPVTVTVQHLDGTATIRLFAVALLAGERLSYVEGQGFRVVDADGVLK